MMEARQARKGQHSKKAAKAERRTAIAKTTGVSDG